jgi:hypothetical protein
MVLRTLAVTSFACVAVGACTERPFEVPAYGLNDGAHVLITIAASSYAPGGLVEFAVHNRSDVVYVWNPCTRTLEGQSSAGWVRVDEGERICTLEGWVLRPGERIGATTDLGASLPPGEYRLRYGFGRVAGEYTVSDQQVSNSFRVMP